MYELQILHITDTDSQTNNSTPYVAVACILCNACDVA